MVPLPSVSRVLTVLSYVVQLGYAHIIAKAQFFVNAFLKKNLKFPENALLPAAKSVK